MTNAITAPTDNIATAHMIAGRAASALRRAIPEASKAPGGLFVAIPLASRLVLLVNPKYTGLGLGANFERELSDSLNGRKVRVTEVNMTDVNGKPVVKSFIQVAYTPKRAETRGELPAYDGRQVVVYGPTGSGKSSVIQHIFGLRDGIKIIIDPHYKPGNWHPDTIVIGAGRKWEVVEPILDEILAEMSRRYETRTSGEDDFIPLTIAVDELSALAYHNRDAVKKLIDLTQEGRKVKVYVILTPHGSEVESMGIAGLGDARDNYVFIGLSPVKRGDEEKQRLAEVHLGNPRRKDTERDGYFIVPAPTLFQGEARLIDTLAGVFGVSETRVREIGHTQTQVKARFEDTYRPDTAETAQLCDYLASNGYSQRKIAEVLPFAAQRARECAARALANTEPGERPEPDTMEEAQLIAELAKDYGVPSNRIARLLDGNDYENLARIERIVKL